MRLTLGQVIDQMEIDEVAIQVETGPEIVGYEDATGIFFDANDNNLLKSLPCNELCISKVFDAPSARFVIVKRELYETIRNSR